MREEDKPFVCYKQGWNMKIVPRNAAGWRAFALWLAALAVLIGLFIATLAIGLGDAGEIIAVVLFLTVTGLWTVAMIRWMLARSEVIDLADLVAIKRSREREQGRPPRS
jgi:type VI protein secretion system component VasK